MPEGALTSFTLCDACRYFVGQSLLLTSKSRSRREYLIQTNNIIVLDHFFNSTKKSSHWQTLIRFNTVFLIIW